MIRHQHDLKFIVSIGISKWVNLTFVCNTRIKLYRKKLETIIFHFRYKTLYKLQWWQLKVMNKWLFNIIYYVSCFFFFLRCLSCTLVRHYCTRSSPSRCILSKFRGWTTNNIIIIISAQNAELADKRRLPQTKLNFCWV